jgi:tetratricopeptide (TPR) repeat protein
LAQANGLENLTTSGLIDLGYSYYLRSDYEEAQRYFKQALEYAQRNKGRRNEARALLSLGSLKMTQDDPDEAVAYTEKALQFYQDAGYRQETAQALLLFGRANRQKGNYDAALRAFQQQLDIAKQDGNLLRQALSEEGLGTVLARREHYLEALTHFENSYSLFSKDNHVARTHGLINRGGMLLALGRYQEAQGVLAEASERAVKVGNKQLQVSINLEMAKAALSQRNFAEAKAKSNSALVLAIASQFKGSIIEGKRILGVATALNGKTRDGIVLCNEALELAGHLKDPWVFSKAQLALAEALLETGDAENSLANATAAQESFSRTQQQDSEWHALLIAARASQRKGDAAKAREFANRSAELLAGLEQRWGADAYRNYLARPDVIFYRRQLQQLPDTR